MPDLVIRYAAGNWWASPLTSEESYRFAGKTAVEQAQQVRNLAAAMQQGEAQVVADANTIFANVPPGGEQALVDDIFSETTELLYESAPLFEASEGETLLDEIAAAGEALATALG